MKNYRVKYEKVAKGFKPLYAGNYATVDFADTNPVFVVKNGGKKKSKKSK